MWIRRIFSLAMVIGVGAWLAPLPGPAPARQTQNVVLVTLDGVRWHDVFFGMDESLLSTSAHNGADVRRLPVYKAFSGNTPTERREKLMPFLWRTLVVEHGSIAGDRTIGSAVTVTNRYWFSYPGYSEILTGQAHDDVIRSNDAVRNPFPTVLQFVQCRLNLSAAEVATFASWGVMRWVAENEEGATTINAGVSAFASPTPQIQALSAVQSETPTPWENVRHDAYTFRFAMDYLKRVHPRVLYIALDEADEWAHDGRYDRVLESLHATDGFLKELWETLEADPRYHGKTTVLVTVDHGRGRTADDWRSHNKNVPGSDEIWLAVASPDLSRRGEWRNHAPLFQNQIAATIASALGLEYREHNRDAGAPIELMRSVPSSQPR